MHHTKITSALLLGISLTLPAWYHATSHASETGKATGIIPLPNTPPYEEKGHFQGTYHCKDTAGGGVVWSGEEWASIALNPKEDPGFILTVKHIKSDRNTKDPAKYHITYTYRDEARTKLPCHAPRAAIGQATADQDRTDGQDDTAPIAQNGLHACRISQTENLIISFTNLRYTISRQGLTYVATNKLEGFPAYAIVGNCQKR